MSRRDGPGYGDMNPGYEGKRGIRNYVEEEFRPHVEFRPHEEFDSPMPYWWAQTTFSTYIYSAITIVEGAEIRGMCN